MSYHKRFYRIRITDFRHDNKRFTESFLPRDFGAKYKRTYMDIRIEKDAESGNYRVYNKDEFMIEFDNRQAAESFRKQYAENMGRKWE